MCHRHTNINVGFVDERFPQGTHMCLIYNCAAEREKIIAKYLKSGLDSGEKVAYFADDMSATDARTWLISQGVTLHDHAVPEQFDVTSTAQTYYPEGYFDTDEMLERLQAFYQHSANNRYPACRVSGEMAWALRGVPGADKIMEYESRVNDLLVDYPVTAICQYDANRFDGATILACLKVHPYMIVHGQIVRNPFFTRTNQLSPN